MGILFRYAFLLGLGLASIFAFVSATAVTGQRLAASSGYVVQDPADMTFVVLALIGVLGLISVVKFIMSGFPSMMRGWYERHKSQITALTMVGVIGAVFLVV